MEAEGFDKASVHWMPMGASCTISIHRGEECKDGVSIRANVPFGNASPQGWQSSLEVLEHGREMTEVETRYDLSLLGPITLEPRIYNTMGKVEIRASTSDLKLWISTHSHKGIHALSAQEEDDYREYLTSLAEMLFGSIKSPGSAGSTVWR